eukprot:m.117155 g.117155  ORF g.117155 m.117155 type:complete len:1593 (+) comp9318_c2_seq3:129-4907(+)
MMRKHPKMKRKKISGKQRSDGKGIDNVFVRALRGDTDSTGFLIVFHVSRLLLYLLGFSVYIVIQLYDEEQASHPNNKPSPFFNTRTLFWAQTLTYAVVIIALCDTFQSIFLGVSSTIVRAIDFINISLFAFGVVRLCGYNIVTPTFLHIWNARHAFLKVVDSFHRQRPGEGDTQLLNLRIMSLFATIACVIMTSMCGVELLERSNGDYNLFSSLWFVFVTFSTVGYGDISPQTMLGQLFVMGMIIVALAILPTQFTAIAEVYRARKERGESFSQGHFSRKKHVVYIGGHVDVTSLEDFLEEMQPERLGLLVHVVILSPYHVPQDVEELIFQPAYRSSTHYIQGSAMNAADLKRASVESAERVFVMAERNSQPQETDKRAILRAWAVKDFAPDVQLHVQVMLLESKRHVEFAHVLCFDEMKYSLLAITSVSQGASTLLTNLAHTVPIEYQEDLSRKADVLDVYELSLANSVHEVVLKSSAIFGDFVGMSFQEAAMHSFDRMVCLIGVARMKEGSEVHEVFLHPSHFILKEDDVCIYISPLREDLIDTRMVNQEEADILAGHFEPDELMTDLTRQKAELSSMDIPLEIFEEDVDDDDDDDGEEDDEDDEVLNSVPSMFHSNFHLPPLYKLAHDAGFVALPSLLYPPEKQQFSLEETDFMYESAWRMGKWNEPLPQVSREEANINAQLHKCISSLVHNPQSTSMLISQSMNDVVPLLLSCGLEDVGAVNTHLLSLQLLEEVDEFTELFKRQESLCTDDVYNVAKVWASRWYQMPQLFHVKEKVLMLRLNLLELGIDTISGYSSDELKEDLVNGFKKQYEITMLTGLSMCRQFKKFNHAVALQERLKTRCSSMYSPRLQPSNHRRGRPTLAKELLTDSLWQIESAKTLWASGDKMIALQMLRYISAHSAEAQRLKAQWTGKLRLEPPDNVIQLFEKSISLACDVEKSLPQQRLSRKTLAEYADNQHMLTCEKLVSSDYKKHLRIMEKYNEEYQNRPSDDSNKRRKKTLKKILENERSAKIALASRLNMYLKCALENYIHCLSLGIDNYYDAVFRVCSLWFNNYDNQELNLIMHRWNRISSHVWLSLVYQLAARIDISSEDDKFQSTLQEIVFTIAKEHPHHTLFVLYALENGEGEYKEGDPMSSKMQAVHRLLDTIQRNSDTMSELIYQMKVVGRAYTQLANKTIESEHKNNPSYFKGDFDLARIQDGTVSKVAVLTQQLSVEPTGVYDENIVYIHKWKSEFEFVGGVNLPRILQCIGTDGNLYKEVIKGKDDSRQDAVMQQVFTMVNHWFRDDPECQRRRLQMRTYKIVPLSNTVGVIEWCKHTKPMGMWLVRDKKNAHKRYRPQDWSSSDCRKAISHPKTNEEKLSTLKTIYNHFKPVFRRFFTETFSDAGEWFERRLAYTRSVATSSMVGHILGLGDRHPNNILLDLNTAELVHIDLGVAFDQGLLLPTPEIIPFRLTRDIIDGMGIAGVEGVFRRCCEKCMMVLRKSKNSLETIVDVFVHDPLSDWKITQQKMQRVQEEGYEYNAGVVEGNEAQEVLIKVCNEQHMLHNMQISPVFVPHIFTKTNRFPPNKNRFDKSYQGSTMVYIFPCKDR